MKMRATVRKEASVLMDLKLTLVRRKIRQTRMAVDLGWDPAKLSRIVNGVIEPNVDDRTAISKYLKLPEEELFGPSSDRDEPVSALAP